MNNRAVTPAYVFLLETELNVSCEAGKIMFKSWRNNLLEGMNNRPHIPFWGVPPMGGPKFEKSEHKNDLKIHCS